MKAPSPPATPDPYATAAAQQMANVEVALAGTALANADEDRPDGTLRFEQIPVDIPTYTYDSAGAVTGTRNIRRWKKVVALTDAGQTQYTQQQQVAIALNTWALGQIGILTVQQANPITLAGLTARLTPPTAANIDTSDATPGAMTMTIGATDLSAHLATTRDAIDARLQYQIDLDRANRVTALANMGLVPGMTAYDRDLLAFDKQSTDARTQAWLAAQKEQDRMVALEQVVGNFKNTAQAERFRQDALVIDSRNARRMMAYTALRDAAEFVAHMRQLELQEQIASRAHQINEISTLMHGGKIDTPSFQPFASRAIDRTPVAESVYQSAAMDMSKYQMKVSQQQAMLGGLLGLAGNIAGGYLSGGMR